MSTKWLDFAATTLFNRFLEPILKYFRTLTSLPLLLARPGKYDININVEQFYNSSIEEMEREIALTDLAEEKLLDQIHDGKLIFNQTNAESLTSFLFLEDEIISMLPIVIALSSIVTILLIIITYIAIKHRFICLLVDNIKTSVGLEKSVRKAVQRTESNAHVIQPSSIENSSSEGENSPPNVKKGSVVAPYAALKNKQPHELIRQQTHSLNVNNQPISRIGQSRRLGSSMVGRLESLPVGTSSSIGMYLNTRSVSSFVADNRSVISKKTEWTDARSTYSGKTSKSGGSNGSKSRGISTGQIVSIEDISSFQSISVCFLILTLTDKGS